MERKRASTIYCVNLTAAPAAHHPLRHDMHTFDQKDLMEKKKKKKSF